MKKLKFTKDEGSSFYKELREQVELYFIINNKDKTGDKKMFFKIGLYLFLDVLFYMLMITSIDAVATALQISYDAAHGVAVKSKFWNKFLFSLSFNLQGNNAYVWGKNHNESHHLYTRAKMVS